MELQTLASTQGHRAPRPRGPQGTRQQPTVPSVAPKQPTGGKLLLAVVWYHGRIPRNPSLERQESNEEPRLGVGPIPPEGFRACNKLANHPQRRVYVHLSPCVDPMSLHSLLPALKSSIGQHPGMMVGGSVVSPQCGPPPRGPPSSVPRTPPGLDYLKSSWQLGRR